MPYAACDDERLFCHLSRDSRQKGGTWTKLDHGSFCTSSLPAKLDLS
jgi:hypothetical protein